MQALRQAPVAAPNGERARPRRSWETPRLTAHGTVGQITAGGGGNDPDSGGGNSALE
jgi:hypothetical protein